MPDLICLYMQQAVAAPLTRYILYSAQFSSCSPLFAFNINTLWGGYYHVPGHGGEGVTRDDVNTCHWLAEVVEPTHVWVFHPGDYVPADQAAGMGLFQRLAVCTATDADNLATMLNGIKISLSLGARDYAVVKGQRPHRSLAVGLINGLPHFRSVKPSPGTYAKVYDPKRTQPPPLPCVTRNWDIDVSAWSPLG
jgi:hypothetical protein